MLSTLIDTTCFRCTSARNRIEYHDLAVCINSANDASISCENFVKFGPVTPELTQLICESQVRHGQFSRISSDIGPTGLIFANFSPYESLLSNLSSDVAMAMK